jgi:hypothetical protein
MKEGILGNNGFCGLINKTKNGHNIRKSHASHYL